MIDKCDTYLYKEQKESIDLKMKDFIKIFTERFYKENDLSDLTYILCKADSDFLRFFVKFNFSDFTEDSPIVEIIREYPLKNSRPDFYISSLEKKYILEIKINDRNNHFEQYNNTFPDGEYKKSFLANYSVDQELSNSYKNWKISTWSDFVDKLKSDTNLINKKYIKSYIQYIKTVCGILEVQHMNFDNLQSLKSFNNLITNLINNNSNNNFKLKIYNSTYSNSDSFNGKYFLLTKNDKKIYPWFGISYDSDIKILFRFYFDKDWCDVLKDKTADIKNALDNKYLLKNNNNENYFSIELSFDEYKKFSDTSDEETQKSIINKFFYEVLEVISNCL